MLTGVYLKIYLKMMEALWMKAPNKSQKEIERSLVNFYLIRGFVAEMATGCLRKIEKINICIKLTKMKF